MFSHSYITLIFIVSMAFIGVEAQGIKSVRLLDLLIRDYALKLYDKRFKTGTIHAVKLPANLSGVKVDAARFRCGSIKRYGAQVKDFHLGPGVSVVPCVERVLVVVQNLSSNWFSLYNATELAGYQLLSPILGLLAYDVGNGSNSTSPLEAEIQPGDKPITISFLGSGIGVDDLPADSPSHLCASFESDGKVTKMNTVMPFVCEATKQGHYALIVKKPPRVQVSRKISLKRVLLGTMIGAVTGVILLGLLFVAIVGKAKMKSRLEELERKTYEEEALQVSMVGHLRALTAAASRTAPMIEHECKPFAH